MKVQELFKDIDIEKLINYITSSNRSFKNKLKQLGEDEFYKLIENSINDILNIKINSSNDYLYFYEYFEEDSSFYGISLIEEKELIKYDDFIINQCFNFSLEKEYSTNDIPTTFAPYGCSWVDYLGYNFSEKSLKEYDFYTILGTIFMDLVYFGFTYETNEQTKKKFFKEDKLDFMQDSNFPIINNKEFVEPFKSICIKNSKNKYKDLYYILINYLT